MYTLRGELNENFLQLLYQKEILKQLENCKNQSEIYKVLKQFLKNVELSEIIESLEIVQSYLDEQQKESIISSEELYLTDSGVQSNFRMNGKNEIIGLMKIYPNIGKSIHNIYKKIQRR